MQPQALTDEELENPGDVYILEYCRDGFRNQDEAIELTQAMEIGTETNKKNAEAGLTT